MFEIKKQESVTDNNTNNNVISSVNKSLSLDSLIDRSNSLLQISSRAADPNNSQLAQLHTFNDEKLQSLAEKMPEINRATRSFGRSNSQTSDKLMSLTMISYSPYRYLHQCLAKIESRRAAIKENQYRLRKTQVEIHQLQLKRKELLKSNNDISTQLELKLIDIEIEEKAVNLNDSMLYLEGALKEIAVYQDAYEQIRKTHNIPDNWDEKDFEQAEIEHHVKSAFNNGVRDMLSSGRLNHGTLEYMHQFGINPITALSIISSYIEDTHDLIKKGQYPTISHLEDFLNKAYEVFKDSYQDTLHRVGITNILTDSGMYLENK